MNETSNRYKRGRCECGECPYYCYSPNNFCSYCGCVPVKHAKLDVEINSTETMKGQSLNANVENCEEEDIFFYCQQMDSSLDKQPSGSKDGTKISSEKTHDLKKPDEKSPFSNLPSDIQQKLDQLNRLIPDSFSANQATDINMGQYSTMERNKFNKVMRTIADKMEKANCTSKQDITLMTSLATHKFPGLKGQIGNYTERMFKALSNCIKNKKSRDSKADSEQGDSKAKSIEGNEKDSFDEIMNEYSKIQNDRGKLKDLLEKTRATRVKEYKKLSAKEMLKKYPPLNDQDLFLWEFGQLIQIPVRILRSNFTKSIEKVLPILKVQLPADVDDINKKVIHLLTYLPQLFDPNKKKLHPIFEMELTNEVPTTNKPPTLISADPEGEQVKCYVDSEPLFCTEPFKAVLLLLAAYYNFNINYAKEQKVQFIFLEHMVFGDEIDRISPKNSHLLTILNVLTRAKMTKFYQMPKA